MKTAILVLTDEGLASGRRLREALPGEVILFGPSCVVGMCGGPADGGSPPGGSFPSGEPGVFGWRGPLRRFVPEVWGEFDAIVAIMALGIVVRLVGPLANDKRRDPAVVAVDDAGRFAISVLGGHGSGANELAGQVAVILGASPVITTASEAWGLPAVDLIGRSWGWTLERGEDLTRVAAAVVRREKVAVYQDAGRRDWWPPFGPWPEHFVRVGSQDELDAASPAAALVISDRVETLAFSDRPSLLYRPKSLVAGIGCKRGVSCEAIDSWVGHQFARHGLSLMSLSSVATVSLKADEPGLIAFAERRGVPLIAFLPEELTDQAGIETPSEVVRSKIGIPAVAEPAALRAAGAARLVVPKQKGPGMTLAIARRPEDDAPQSAKNDGGPNPGA
jgi:cobalt-precorrin 5A hydrolase